MEAKDLGWCGQTCGTATSTYRNRTVGKLPHALFGRLNDKTPLSLAVSDCPALGYESVVIL